MVKIVFHLETLDLFWPLLRQILSKLNRVFHPTVLCHAAYTFFSLLRCCLQLLFTARREINE